MSSGMPSHVCLMWSGRACFPGVPSGKGGWTRRSTRPMQPTNKLVNVNVNINVNLNVNGVHCFTCGWGHSWVDSMNAPDVGMHIPCRMQGWMTTPDTIHARHAAMQVVLHGESSKHLAPPRNTKDSMQVVYLPFSSGESQHATWRRRWDLQGMVHARVPAEAEPLHMHVKLHLTGASGSPPSPSPSRSPWHRVALFNSALTLR